VTQLIDDLAESRDGCSRVDGDLRRHLYAVRIQITVEPAACQDTLWL
jgi:hypothetical protein